MRRSFFSDLYRYSLSAGARTGWLPPVQGWSCGAARLPGLVRGFCDDSLWRRYFLFLVWGRGQVHTRGRRGTRQRGGPTSEFTAAGPARSAFSETLVRTKRAKEIERSDAKRFGEGRMLVATRELRRPILSLRAPPKRLQAALRFLRVLGRRLRCGFGLLVFFPSRRPPLVSPLCCFRCHC